MESGEPDGKKGMSQGKAVAPFKKTNATISHFNSYSSTLLLNFNSSTHKMTCVPTPSVSFVIQLCQGKMLALNSLSR